MEGWIVLDYPWIAGSCVVSLLPDLDLPDTRLATCGSNSVYEVLLQVSQKDQNNPGQWGMVLVLGFFADALYKYSEEHKKS